MIWIRFVSKQFNLPARKLFFTVNVTEKSNLFYQSIWKFDFINLWVFKNFLYKFYQIFANWQTYAYGEWTFWHCLLTTLDTNANSIYYLIKKKKKSITL